MHRIATLNRRVPHGALVMLERSAGKLARSVLRGEGSREAPDLPGGFGCTKLESEVTYSTSKGCLSTPQQEEHDARCRYSEIFPFS
jgi:hypothetical protein